MKRIAEVVFLAVLCLVPVSADAGQLQRSDPGLTVVSTSPTGEVASLAEANEIRIVFSDPMVSLGRIPADVRPSFFAISPAVSGTFRWSGTTVLIFTPDPKRPLPYATTYRVTIAAGTAAASGLKLAKPVAFSFTTPTARLLRTAWYRRGGTVDGRMVLMLRFNQPVRAADVASSLSATLEPHVWTAPAFSTEEQTRLTAMDPHHLTDEGLLTVWPPEYRQWAIDNREDRPTAGSNVIAAVHHARTNEQPESLRIASPPDGATYFLDPTLRREFQSLSLRAVIPVPGPVEWSVDRRSLGTVASDGRLAWSLVPGRHTFVVRDASGRSAESTIVVR